MRKKEIIQKILNDYFPNPKIPLLHKDPYTLLIATLLSAQCTDKRVNEVTPKLFTLASTPQKMAALSLTCIEEIIRPCGLFKNKAKAIKNLSQMLLDRFHGKVPRTFASLESLPGVGHKTASVVMCQAFHRSAFPVDTHIHRLAKRWNLSRGKSVKETERDLKRLFPKKSWPRLHLQIIYYARQFCPARGHIMERCPICQEILQNERASPDHLRSQR